MKPISVFIVDDHAITRAGLCSLLGTQKSLTVVGEAGDGRTAVRKILETRPDVIIMDLMMPGMDGSETTQELLAKWPEAKVLLLTTFGSADGLAHALAAGAIGALLKSAALPELMEAIRNSAAGRQNVSDEIAQLIEESPPVPELSERQREILKSVTCGLSNTAIASQFRISLPMVKEHLSAIFAKLGAANRAEAVAIALRKHLLKL